MNERIRQIAEQCWDQRLDGQLHFDTEHFAELIVRECAGKVDFILREKSNGGGTMGDEIREHFEVKEQVTEPSELHTCPYAEEIHNDYETLCDCDEEHTYQCAMNV